MHNNFYFLRKLSDELKDLLIGSVVSECFSQNKDELIVRFETSSKSIFIKASLLPHFCCLSFPTDFNRARKNSVDLFKELIGQRVAGVRQYNNERCFSIEFSQNHVLLFKLHGNRSNLILFQENKAISLFKNHLIADLDIGLDELDKAIDWSKEAFLKNQDNLPQHYFTFGKVLWTYLNSKGFEKSSTEDKWEAIQNLHQQLELPSYYITELNQKIILSLVPVGKPLSSFKTAMEAIHEFFTRYSIQTGFQTEKRETLARLQTQLKNSEAYLSKTKRKLEEIEASDHYRLWADLIMANLHTIIQGTEKITVPDFYNENKLVEIKLKKEINAQKNAEVYYRKSKNHHIEVEKLKESIKKKLEEVKKITTQLHQLENAENLKDLRVLTEKFGLITKSATKVVTLPYHEVEHQGYKIWIGKNAKQNDDLTLRFSFKEDLWLHAKDVAGSHVLIKHQAGKNFPKEVIERAAQLAAYHSRRKTDTLCPVAITPKKYVRKRKGDPPGSVVVEKEEVILVEPKP